MICDTCGQDTTALTNGRCGDCIIQSSNYDYKCPDCKGEFNTPAFDPTITLYKCPFCGREMVGLN